MSDQFTRIRCGGSPLPPGAPAAGLLFGSAAKTAAAAKKAGAGGSNKPSSSPSSPPTSASVALEIRDAEDIPVDLSEAALLQEQLHRAVFPSDRVVGWYRVSESDAIGESDVALTRRLAGHYSPRGGSPSSREEAPFVFALLVISGDKKGDAKKTPSSSSSPSKTDDGGDGDDDEAALPLSLYRLDGEGAALLHLPDWALETLDPERIAVERVLREQPSSSSSSSSRRRHPRSATAPEAASLKPAPPAAEADFDDFDFDESTSRFVRHADALDKSLAAIHKRLEVLRSFLEDTAAGRVPYNPPLLRQVNAVVVHAASIQRPRRPAGGGASSSPLVPLAHLVKTADAVRQYAEKFRVAHESSAQAAAGAGGGGGGTAAYAAAAAAAQPGSSSSSRIREREFGLYGY
jgi:hypothetical protein